MNGKGMLLLLTLLALSSCWQLQAVPCQVANCSICDPTNTTCTACRDGFYLNEAASQCSPCDSAVANCASCTINSTADVICDVCQPSYYPTNNGSLCKLCISAITDCMSCSIDADETVTCDACNSPDLPTEDALSCKTCFGIITNCQVCDEVGKLQKRTCKTCDQGYELSEDSFSCEDSSSKTWIIIVAVVGAVVLIGIIIALVKCHMKKKEGENLLDDKDDKEFD